MKIFSGLKPSGIIHIGNYAGAIKQWLELQNDPKNQCFYCLVDLHALTTNPPASEIHKNTLEAIFDYLALGLDPKKSVIFIQSQVPAHSELAWILNTLTPLGDLKRMTQFKELAKDAKTIRAGILNYPVLMAADILLYDTELVPVGEDQLQHLELTRTLAKKFNDLYGETFVIPKAKVFPVGARIMSLDNPSKKMAKSGNPQGYLGIFEPEKEIRRKIMAAVTDSGKEIKYDSKNKPAISDLLNIFNVVSGKTIKQLEKEFEGKGYAFFKEKLADSFLSYFFEARAKRKKLEKNPKLALGIFKKGAVIAQKIAQRKITETKQKIGLL